MRAGSKDVQVKMLIGGGELAELKRHTWQMAEAFGLDTRVERYQGKRPIGLHRWDFDCLIDVVGLLWRTQKSTLRKMTLGTLRSRGLTIDSGTSTNGPSSNGRRVSE